MDHPCPNSKKKKKKKRISFLDKEGKVPKNIKLDYNEGYIPPKKTFFNRHVFCLQAAIFKARIE